MSTITAYLYFKAKRLLIAIPFYAMVLATVAYLAPTTLAANNLGQAGSQQSAANINQNGSDDSMEEASVNAMKAIMNLAALNIPGAFSNGYKAYGEYLNSEELDDLESKNNALKGSLSSVGKGVYHDSKTVPNAPASGQSNSSGISKSSVASFSRLNSSYLYKGEAAAVAEEFEKRSGMKREEFLAHLASATDAGLNYDDPQLMEKLVARYDAFTSRIPNKEFREGLTKASTLFPSAARTKVLGQLADLYFNRGGGSITNAIINTMFGSNETEGQKTKDASNNTVTATTQTPNANSFAQSNENLNVADRDISSEKNSMTDDSLSHSMFIGINKDSKESLAEYFQSSNLGADSDTLFMRVSKRYRELTPSILKN